MVSTNQKRKHIRVGANLVAKVSLTNSKEKIVFVKNVSAVGAKIECRDLTLQIGDIMNLKFKYKNVQYNVLCKVVRTENISNFYGVQFYFKGDSEANKYNNNIDSNSNKTKLYQDILEEYFKDRDLFI